MLVLSTKGIWITRLKFKPIEENATIENSMRAEIERAKIEGIEQVESERIVSITFRHPDGNIRKVVAEFFGEGNLIICDENLQILSILNRIEVRHRTLAPGLRYVPPPKRGTDVFELTLEKITALVAEGKNLDVLRWLGRAVSLPKKFVEEIVVRANVESSKKAGELSRDEIEKIYESIQKLVSDVSSGQNHSAIVVLQSNEGNKEGKPIDALPIITQEAEKFSTKQVPSYMEAVDEVLSSEILDIGRSSKTIEIDKQISLLEHDLEEQNKAKESVVEKSRQIRKLASGLMELSYSMPQTRPDQPNPKIEELLASHSAQITTVKGVKYIEISGEQVQFENNLAKTSSELFVRAKELERGSSSIDEARKKLMEQITKLRTKTEAIQKKVIVQQQTSRDWYERYRWFITTNGLMAIGGRDASSNSALIRKHLTEDDIIFHAEVHGSPFFILKNAAASAESGSIDDSLNQVASATVGFSRAWKDGLSSADAYWVTSEQIKKGAPTGQFLPKGSFVIEGKRNYLKGVEIRLAIGLLDLNNRLVLVCGPETAIKPRCLYYAVLVQGGLDPMNAAKKVKAEFVSIAQNSSRQDGHDENAQALIVENIKQLSLDDVVRALPTGQSRVSFTARGQNLAAGAALAASHKSN